MWASALPPLGFIEHTLTGLWNPCSSVKPVSSVVQQEIDSRRPIHWNASKDTVNPSPAGTPENSQAIHRWVIAQERNESRQGRKNSLPRETHTSSPQNAVLLTKRGDEAPPHS